MSWQFEGLLAPYKSISYAAELDVFEPFAFQEWLINNAHKPLPLIYFHERRDVVGSCSPWEDARGLWIRGTIEDTLLGGDLWKLISAGHMRGLSLGFQSLKHQYRPADPAIMDQIRKGPYASVISDEPIRYISKAFCHEATILAFPADDTAQITKLISKPVAMKAKEAEKAHAAAFTSVDAGRQMLHTLRARMDPLTRARLDLQANKKRLGIA